MTKETRDRRCPLRVVVSASERSRIEERAQAAGLSVSAYLRTAGLCHPIRSAFDHEAVVELARVNGDQGRLGCLLKLWLADRPGFEAPEREVRLLLDRIAELQSRLAEIAARI
jgi:Mobilization protein NikA